jgi:hypothetical protein
VSQRTPAGDEEQCRRQREAAKYSENRAFRDQTATASEYKRSVLQSVMRQIRYLADQRISAGQRILSIE